MREIDAGRLVDEELERTLVAAVKAAMNQPTPRERATAIIAKTLGRLAKIDGDSEGVEHRLARIYEVWARKVADALIEADLIKGG